LSKNKQITVLEESVRLQRIQKEVFICFIGIAKHKNADDSRFVIQNWVRARFIVGFLGIWEQLNNLGFNRIEFEAVKNESGRNAFVTPEIGS